MNTALYEVLYVSTLAPDQPPQVVAEIAAHARPAIASMCSTAMPIIDGQRFC